MSVQLSASNTPIGYSPLTGYYSICAYRTVSGGKRRLRSSDKVKLLLDSHNGAHLTLISTSATYSVCTILKLLRKRTLLRIHERYACRARVLVIDGAISLSPIRSAKHGFSPGV